MNQERVKRKQGIPMHLNSLPKLHAYFTFRHECMPASTQTKDQPHQIGIVSTLGKPQNQQRQQP